MIAATPLSAPLWNCAGTPTLATDPASASFIVPSTTLPASAALPDISAFSSSLLSQQQPFQPASLPFNIALPPTPAPLAPPPPQPFLVPASTPAATFTFPAPLNVNPTPTDLLPLGLATWRPVPAAAATPSATPSPVPSPVPPLLAAAAASTPAAPAPLDPDVLAMDENLTALLRSLSTSGPAPIPPFFPLAGVPNATSAPMTTRGLGNPFAALAPLPSAPAPVSLPMAVDLREKQRREERELAEAVAAVAAAMLLQPVDTCTSSPADAVLDVPVWAPAQAPTTTSPADGSPSSTYTETPSPSGSPAPSCSTSLTPTASPSPADDRMIKRTGATARIRFRCPTCSRPFARRSHYTAHLLTHTGRRDHACGQCEARFVRVHDLRRHEETTHDGAAVPAVVGKGGKRRTKGVVG
ncbi:hypothetical protein HDU96_010258, partial [Phlyctochytrium bullatum]